MDREDVYEFIKQMKDLMLEQLQIDIVDHLYDCGHFTEEEYTEILSHDTRRNRLVSFLDKLPSKTKTAFNDFLDHQKNWYPWVLEEYNDYLKMDNTDALLIEKTLSDAEVPSLPLKHVSRQDELILLTDHLHSMKRGEYVVVHGMGGCGKSTLIIEALRRSPSLVIDSFKNKIFWLMVGRESAVKKEALNEAKVKELTIQQELYTKLFTTGGYSSPPLPLDNEDGKRKLRDKLSESDFEECLLVLDDVPSSNFIECLNIGCKILVTTDNENIMDSVKATHPIKFLKIAEGFTEEESLGLFKKNLDSSIPFPTQAKNIHALCKGFPLAMSLIASQLAEFKNDVENNTYRWDACVKHLKNKDIEAAIGRCDKHRQEQITSLHKALEMSIDSLSPELQQYYQDFALFMDDVNITPQVLVTLWNQDKLEVENIMKAFEKKCLVISTWNTQLRCYVYGVHDLLLDYLKRRLTSIELQALHQKLINRYREKFGQDFVKFPRDDNYIFLYLGYHLKEAGCLSEFPKLYLDLEFIETKILIHGAADVLYDFKKYKDFITTTENNTKKYEELYSFVSRIGICRVLSSSDIVQFALAQCKESYVYKMGEEMAKKSDKKYFEYLTEIPKECSSPDVHPLRGEKITAAIFTSDGNAIVANANNQIKVIDMKTHETIITYEGHGEKITRLALSSLKVFFLSSSEGCEVKIWYLNGYGGKEAFEKPRTPSPSLSQRAWTDNFLKQRVTAEKPVEVLRQHSLPITDVNFSPKGLNIVTASQDKTIIVWNLEILKNKSDLKLQLIGTAASRRVIHVNELVTSCCFTDDEKYVICATKDNLIMSYDTEKGEAHSCTRVDFTVNSVAFLPNALSLVEFVVLGENYKAVYEILPDGRSEVRLREEQYSTLSRHRQDECICAAVSSDGKYLALAPTFYCIIVKEIRTNTEVAKFHETNGKICSISWSFDNRAIMTTYEGALFKVWHLPKETDDKIVKLKASVFDAAWIPDQEDKDDQNDELLVTAVLDTEHNINIYHDLQRNKKISKQPPNSGDICKMCVCPVNGNVIYACKDGTVGIIVFEDTKSQFVSRVPCNKVLKLKAFSHGNATAVLLLVEKVPKKCKLVGWYNDGSMGDTPGQLGKEIVYVDEGESIIDFNVDLERNLVYVAKYNQTFDIFDLRDASDLKPNNFSDGDDDSENDEEGTEAADSNQAKFADFSPLFSFMVSGNDSEVLLTRLTDCKRCSMPIDSKEIPTVCKLNRDEEYVAIGYKSGRVKVHDTKTKKEIEFDKLANTYAVFDLTWSSRDNKLIVISDREIALYDVSAEGCRLISVVYLSVEKAVVNKLFSRIVSIDNGGHFHVLKLSF
ncbi:apoptotic protease-activating factor 1 isoform X2 [Planococcus citri]|uniref:apoptotic protease-activating factor 1 isoform X2 n=1 Tax=Planococcus citri TaxID=170843 RepID=UPI0031F8CE3F